MSLSSLVIRERLLASGGQAAVSMLSCEDGTQWAAKRYKLANPIARYSAQDEWTKLTELKGTELTSAGWSRVVPAVLPLNESPLELIEQWFHGDQLVRKWGQMSEHLSTSLVSALAAWLLEIWFDRFVQIGDFRFSNILVNCEMRQLCLVDVGLPAPEYAALHLASPYTPASRDLGYLVFTMASERYSWLHWRDAKLNEAIGEQLLAVLLPQLSEHHGHIRKQVRPVANFFLRRTIKGRGIRRCIRVLKQRLVAYRLERVLSQWGL